MPTAHEHFSAQFQKWETRGRGWQVFAEPIEPEPPFQRFQYRAMAETPAVDDGQRPTLLYSMVQKLSRMLATAPPPAAPNEEEEPEPTLLTRDSLVELQALLSADLDIAKESFEHFFSNLTFCREPMAFELLGTHKRVLAQFAVSPDDASQVRKQLQAHFPDAVFLQREGTLENAWAASDASDVLAVEFGLEREFMLPLASGKFDSFVGIIGALSELQPGEIGLFQVLWQPVRNPWAESITDSVTNGYGKPFFEDFPELTSAAEEMVAQPLFAAVVRFVVKTARKERTLELACGFSASLRVFANPQGNELIPLSNEDYGFEDHVQDVLLRQTRRSGMLLSADELIGFVHLPSSAVRSPVLERQVGKTKAAPSIVRLKEGLLLGTNEHIDESVPVRLSTEQRVRHTHIIGTSGSGKSTLLFNLICQDIEAGQGVAVLDPHGDLINRILGIIPPERVADVVLVDPSDEEYSVGFNILSAHSELEKNLLASDLVSVFQRLSTSWGDQMNSVLQNAVLAFLESTRRGTIADLQRFLIEPAFRNEFLKTVQDSQVVYYWQKSFPHLSGNKSIGSILTRLDAFLSKKPIRHLVSQPENRLDFAHIMDTGKIFLAKLPEGLLGRENSHLLGSFLVSKFQQMVMSRQAQQITARRDFWLYIDEFANFITPSMAEILSGARKYRIGLTLAHHELHQLQRDSEVASAVMSHPCTRIVFRVSDDDAKKLADGFSGFEARDLRNLEAGHAICRVERSDYDFNLHIPLPEEPDPVQASLRRHEVITASREKYARRRADIDAEERATKEKPKPEAAQSEPAQPKTKSAPPPVPKDAETKPVPNLAEVPKPADSIPGTATIPIIKEPTPVVREPSRDLGRGGEQHKTIQERIQHEAQALGFQALIEQQLAEGSMQAADLILRKEDCVLAVEITITTTVDHEFGNVKKCLAAGFARVAVVSPKLEKLQAIKEALKAGLGAEEAAKVSFHTPDELIGELKRLAAEAATKPLPPSIPDESSVRGYTVRRHKPIFTPEEQRVKEEMAHKVLVQTMKQRH